MTYKALYTILFLLRLMPKVELVSKEKYLKYKSLCNRYEREYRKRNPTKHQANSRHLINAIVKKRLPKQKKVKQERVEIANV